MIPQKIKNPKHSKEKLALLEAIESYEHLTISELHKECTRIVTKCIDQYPVKWQTEIKSNVNYKALKALIKRKRHV